MFMINRENRLKLLNKLCWIPDIIVIKIQFYITMKKWLNLNNVKTFNEKLQWLKLHDRKNIHTNMADKLLARDIVEEKIGKEYLIPLLGNWQNYDDIDFSKLPDRFVLKCNHDSGSVKIIHDKSTINHTELKRFFSNRLNQNPYSYGREWPYKNIKPCIIAEEYLGDENGVLPADYKFFCFDGIVDSVMVCTGRGFKEKRFFFFDRNWTLKKYNLSSQGLPQDFKIYKPEVIDQLFDVAAKMSIGEKFVRIDFYIINNKIYFGEYTFFPASGYDNKITMWADEYLGSLIEL